MDIKFKEIRSARRRALSMGKYCSWKPRFDAHPLAACISNYTYIIDVEREQLINRTEQSFLNELIWVHQMAVAVNTYCDKHKVDVDKASQYWLERFLWVNIDAVANIDLLAA